MNERPESRAEIFDTVVDCAIDHLIGLQVIDKLGGFPKSLAVLKNRIPTEKIASSGLLGEILATEYVEQETEFSVPVRRLRYRDTRQLAMRGDDVLGFRNETKGLKIVKVEAKSRANLNTIAIKEAREGLSKHNGRPNPETLAFLSCNLRLHDRDAEAEPIESLQKHPIRDSDVCHLIFTFSGNDPQSFLEANCGAICSGIALRLCGCRIKDHGKFVKSIVDACIAKGNVNGID